MDPPPRERERDVKDGVQGGAVSLHECVVTNVVSIDYLTKPLEIVGEMHRGAAVPAVSVPVPRGAQRAPPPRAPQLPLPLP